MDCILEDFADHHGFTLDHLLGASREEFCRWSKLCAGGVVQHAALHRAWKKGRDDPILDEITTIEELCAEADTTVEEISTLTKTDFGKLAIEVLNLSLYQATILGSQCVNELKRAAATPVDGGRKAKVQRVNQNRNLDRHKTTHGSANGTTVPVGVKVKVKDDESPERIVSAPPTKNPRPQRKKINESTVATVEDLICKDLGILHSVNVSDPPTPALVALSCGYSNPASKTFSKALKQARIDGYVEKKTMTLTPMGIASHQPENAPVNNDEMHQYLCTKLENLKHKEVQAFQLLSDGKEYKITEVGSALGYSNLHSKGFIKVMKILEKLGLVTKLTKCSVQLKDIAFPYGRPE